MDIEIANHSGERIKFGAVAPILKKIARVLRFPSKSLISVTFLNSEEITKLNQQYRNKNEPADVLTFDLKKNKSFSLPKFVRAASAEIFICPQAVREKAAARNIGEQDYLRLLLVHSLLHLRGLDHRSEEDAQKMENMEHEILKKLR